MLRSPRLAGHGLRELGSVLAARADIPPMFPVTAPVISNYLDVQALIDRSDVLRLSGGHAEGAALVEQALAAPSGTPAQLARARALLALHRLRLGDHEQAIAQGLVALAQHIELGDLSAQSRVHSTLALAYSFSKLDQQGLHHLVGALETARACSDLQAECWALSRAGVVYEAVGDIPRGMDFCRQSLSLARSLHDEEALFAALNNLASAGEVLADSMAAAGENPSAVLHQALADGREAVAMACHTQGQYQESIARSNVATLLLKMKRLAEAREAMEHALAQVTERGYAALGLQIRFDQVQLLQAEGRLEESVALAQSLLPLFDDKTNAALALRVRSFLYERHKALGQFELALLHHECLSALKLQQAEQTAGLQSRILINRLELDEARHRAERSQHDAVMQRRRAEDLDREAHTDALTGLLNRRFIDRQLPHLMRRASERGLPLVAVVIDLDHFKAVNDSHGHAVGDRVLAEMATLLRQATRGSDLAARMGGEEFLIVLVDAPLQQAVEVCERVRAAVQNHVWHAISPNLQCTASLGLSTLLAAETLPQWLARADAALYTAKREGRNRVVMAT